MNMATKYNVFLSPFFLEISGRYYCNFFIDLKER